MPCLLLATYCCFAIYKDSWLSVSKAKLGTLLKNWLGKFKQISNIDHFLSNFLHWIKRKAKLKNGRANKREIGVKVWTKDKMIRVVSKKRYTLWLNRTDTFWLTNGFFTFLTHSFQNTPFFNPWKYQKP